MRKTSKLQSIKAFKEGINYLIKRYTNVIPHQPKSKNYLKYF